MIERVPAHDWSRTPLGPMARWPQCLRTTVAMVLAAPVPMALWWGPGMVFIYNDAYAPFLGPRHPGALGRSGRQVWSEAWPKIGPLVEAVMRRGESVSRQRDHFVLERHGSPEDAWFTWSYSPVPDDSGGVGGLLNVAYEETAAVRAEAARRAGDARLRALAATSRSVLYRMSADWSELQPLDGKGLVASTDAPIRDWLERNIPASEHAAIRARIGRCIADLGPFEMEHRVYRPDRSVGWTHSRAVPVFDATGALLEWVGTAEDVTERRGVEVALRESEEHFRLMADAIPQFVWVTDQDGRALFFNQQWYAYTGAPHEDVTASDVAATFLHPDDAAATMAAFDEARRRGNTFLVEHRIRAKDGGYRWFTVRGEPYRDPTAGRIARWYGASSDIHDRRLAEEALRESERRFRELADAMPQIVWVTRPDGFHEYYNRRWYEFTGRPEGSTDGAGWNGLLHPDDQPRAWAAWRHSLATGEPYEIEYRLRHHGGAYRWTLGRALPVRDAAGRVERWFGTCTDIDAIKRLVDEREALLASERAARAEAERASRMKDEFLATLSHELRTPLNAILGWSQVLATGGRDEADLADGLRTIERNARAQTQIIADLLDMSRITSGKVRLDVQRVDLGEVVRQAVETARLSAEAKGIGLLAVLDPHAATVNGDPGRLQQVFWNLLSNAVKFTPVGGQVRVVLERADGHVEVSVTDTGEGIAAEFLPHVFDRFRQADASTTRRHGGLGLGLSIVKQLVELHGGSVRATSPGVGHGSTFNVALPLAAAHPAPQAEPDRHPPAGADAAAGSAAGANLDPCPPVTGIRVLVVDDEPDALSLVRRLLEDCGAAVRTAASADEAIALLADGPPPDVL
ncbi:MAG TPA: PAS domain-containing protein, partial [Tepidisphaeraceae bacterium]|nr:PAS domain-containing protein [Tepidisphaeraceae bacterium]